MSQAGINSSTTAPSPPDVPTQFTTDAGIAIPALNNLNIFGSPGASTSAAGSTITIHIVGSGFKWNSVTSATNPNSLIAENGYVAKGAGVIQFVLPAVAAFGDTFRIEGYGNLWVLNQNAGQSIIFNNITSTIGVGGSVTATMVSDAIDLLCVTANTEFKITASMGNPTIV